MPCCRLRSRKGDNIPDHYLFPGRSLMIGRNHICRIKTPSCPRQMFKVTMNTEQKREIVLENIRENQTSRIVEMDVIKGPGFEYQVEFVDEKVPIIWTELSDRNLIKAEFMGGSNRSKEKVAAFDLDGTIITTKSGKTFPENRDDWCLIDKNMPKHLCKLIGDLEYRFIIITNQMGISNDDKKIDDFKKKMENILMKLSVPCTVFIAPNDDRFRKPNTGVWEYLHSESETINENINRELSFFVGDAAGRKKVDKKSKSDHSSADLLFAYNCGLKFFTPEKFVELMARTGDNNAIDLKQCQMKALMSSNQVFNPQMLFHNNNSSSKLFSQPLLQNFVTNAEYQLFELPQSLHAILLVGLPATGKSTFYHNHLKDYNYDYINRDTLKTMDKCLKMFEECLKSKRKCVIDNINVTVAQRSPFIEIANKFNAPIVAFYFELPVEHIFHNLKFRKLTDDTRQEVKKVAVYTARKNMQPLQVDEGYHAIVKVNFFPHFNNESYEKLYSRYLLDK